MKSEESAIPDLEIRRYHCGLCDTTTWTVAQMRRHGYGTHGDPAGVPDLVQSEEDDDNDADTPPTLCCPAEPCSIQLSPARYQSAHQTLRRHYWAVHNQGADTWTVETVRPLPPGTVEYLYIINKHAKKYARLGTENYQKGKKATAKQNSLKKKALYAVKEVVLSQIYESADDCCIHVIDGDEFWLLDFGCVSFHSPMDTLDLDVTTISERRELDDFAPGERKEKYSHSLKDSLLFFERELEICANDYLDQQYVSYGHNSYFAGWDYLGK